VVFVDNKNRKPRIAWVVSVGEQGPIWARILAGMTEWFGLLPGGKKKAGRPDQPRGWVVSDEHHAHEPAEPDRGSMTGFAAIKYTAIVIIVLAIMAFLAWYLIPLITD
jgi:hypothetical protein